MTQRLKKPPQAQHHKEYTYIQTGGESDSLLYIGLEKHVQPPQENGEHPKDSKKRVETNSPPPDKEV